MFWFLMLWCPVRVIKSWMIGLSGSLARIMGRAVAQAVSRWIPTMAARVQARV
jgi:hypothetical protein